MVLKRHQEVKMGRRLEAKNCQQQLQNIHDVEILGSGVYLPRMRVDSVSLMDEIKSEKNYGIPASWLSETVGIIERRYVSGDDKPSSMAVKAAEPALSARPAMPPSIAATRCSSTSAVGFMMRV